MNGSTAPARALLAECAIAVSVCAAGYIFLVDPVKQDLSRARAQLNAATAEQSKNAGSSTLSEAQVADLRAVVADRSGRIAARSAPARDQAALFSSIMALGAEHNVRIDQIQPGVTSIVGEGAAGAPQPRQVFPQPGAGATDPGAPAEPPKPRDVRTTCTLVVQGTFGRLTSFLSALQNDLGYTAITDLRVNPTPESGPETVAATIQTEHFAFDLGPLAGAGPKSASAEPSKE